MSDRKVSVDEVRKHDSPDDCWIVVDGAVWDLSAFAPDHPGGAQVITRHAGSDASTAYNSIHSPSLLAETLTQSAFKGRLDTSTITPEWTQSSPPESVSRTQSNLEDSKPRLESIISTHDFESAASRTLTPKTWAFYSSAATDCITASRNADYFSRIWFRPRVLRNVSVVDTRTTILGHDIGLPLYVAPAALAKLAHPDGEKAIAIGCEGPTKIPQVISTNASFPFHEIVSSSPTTPFFFQLYVNKSRPATERLLSDIQSRTPSISALWVTVDAPIPGKREADERIKADEALSSPVSGASAKNDARGGGLGRVMGAYIDASLGWEDVPWLRRVWRGKIVLKGLQTVADARRAVGAGVDGIVLSNHGGRSLDTSTPAVMVLLELHRNCPEVFDKVEVYVDGGVRRGSDVVKCLCLGAKAVGMGRPFLYAVNYGAEGVEKLVDIVKDEVETTMRMLGARTVAELHPGLLNTRDVDHLIPEKGWRGLPRWARL